LDCPGFLFLSAYPLYDGSDFLVKVVGQPLEAGDFVLA